MNDESRQTPDRDSFLYGIEFAATLCELMEQNSRRKSYQEAASWLAEVIREKGVRHAQKF